MRGSHKVKARDYRDAATSRFHLEPLEIGKGKNVLTYGLWRECDSANISISDA